MDLNIQDKLTECHEHRWDDMLSKFDSIVQSLIDNPSCGHQIKTAIVYWSDAVDCRIAALPPEENNLMLHNPSMNMQTLFGAEI